MNINEQKMSDRGSDKVWKTIRDKNGNFKKVSNTQIGQQLLVDEGLRILPSIMDWIKNGSSKVDRVQLNEFFTDEDIVLEKIVQTFLLLAGSIYTTPMEKRWRQKEIGALSTKVLPELPFEIVWRFVEIIIDYSEFFSSEQQLVPEGKLWKTRIKYTCDLSETILAKIAAKATIAFFPLPMLNPPGDWEFKDGKIIGGYDTTQYEMVMSTTKDIDYNLFSEDIFRAINYIQAVPWKINKTVLQQVKLDLKIPKREDYIKSEFPDVEGCEFNIDIKDENCELSKREIEKVTKARDVFKTKIEIYNAEKKEFESNVGKYRNSKMAVEIAEQYEDDTIWFPYFYDFRGRIYPLSVGLSPQGSDLVKSLLEYAENEELTTAGEKWCWSYMASLYGDDKIPFEERVVRGLELLDADYKEADEPYQFLAHQLEMQKYVDNNSYIPKIRIHLDACNSGSQFTSAITKDKAGCIATNVIPTCDADGKQIRKDAYLLVANKSINLTKEAIKNDDAKDPIKKQSLLLIKQMLKKNGRKICKRPVMVSNYGGTNEGRVKIMEEMFVEFKVDRKIGDRKAAHVFSKIVGDSIVGVLNGGKAFEGYIQKMNGLIARTNKPVIWRTADGFHVVHFKNKELKTKRISCLLPNSRKKTTIIKKLYSKKANGAKMRSAISPNYIHSLDAELLRMVALRLEEEGIYNTDWIHDSFGCSPNHVDMLLQITKEEFLKLIQSDPLKRLDDELRNQIPITKSNEKILSQISRPDLSKGEFSDEDFKQVLDSNWFFS